jgi:hypothetical protein
MAMTQPMRALLALGLLLTSSGCAFTQKAVDSALGLGDRQMREAKQMQRRERAAQLDDAEIERRLTFIEERLDDQQFHAAAWEYGWLLIVGGGGIAAATQAALEEEGSTHQNNNIAQAGKAVIGVTYLSLNPMPATSGADPIREMPSATREERMEQLASAEDLLARTAERAHNRWSWWLHIGTVFINAAAAAPALAYGDEGLAAQSFFIGVAAGEAQAWSQPWYGPQDWADYERFAASNGKPLPVDPETKWRIVPTGTGVAVLAEF